MKCFNLVRNHRLNMDVMLRVRKNFNPKIKNRQDYILYETKLAQWPK
jgi:hypothetical protein